MRRRRGLSVRAKVLACVMAVAGTGMLVGEGVSYVVQSRAIETRIDAAVEQEVAEFRAFATEGVDPDTGEAFGSVQQLLVIALQRNVPDADETFLALVDGRPFRYSAGERPFNPEQEPEVLAAVAGLDRASPVLVTDVATSVGRVRLAAVQVSIQGQSATGTYLIAYAVEPARDGLVDTTGTYALISGVTLLLLALVGWVVAGRMLKPLRLLREASGRVTESDLTQRIPLRGNDDVTDLTRNFNGMLDRLDSAFETQRQFTDDAGHELRTPVTILRGHLELMDPKDPVEVAETREILLDEVDRMSRMVEDLILLARTQRPDFLIIAPVDVGTLTDDLLDKGRALGQRTWVLDGRAEGVVEADGHRLTQAVLQLVHNAVRYSGEDTTVGVGSRWRDGALELWVRDTGVGIPASEHRHVFERFARVGDGRSTAGSGLGLSIVGAIAAAHGGRVDLESAPGMGSVFTLVIPTEHPPGGTDAAVDAAAHEGADAPDHSDRPLVVPDHHRQGAP